LKARVQVQVLDVQEPRFGVLRQTLIQRIALSGRRRAVA
jgi:hypothetical protein